MASVYCSQSQSFVLKFRFVISGLPSPVRDQYLVPSAEIFRPILGDVPADQRTLELMPTIHPPRLIKPGMLAEMKRSSVRDLLSPFTLYFESRGVPLGEVDEGHFDLNRLYEVLAAPVESTPPELVERLELLDLVGETQSALNFESQYHEVVDRLREADDTAADLAVKILMHAPDVAWREFDRRVLGIPRTLVSFRVAPELPFRPVTEARIEEFRGIVAEWFVEHARGGVCRLQHREEPGGRGFVIRHGDLLKRFDVLDEEGNAASRILRRERVDVAHFRESTREWQISGVGAKVRELYRETFGLVFHGSATALAPSQRYSLEPLRRGPEALAWDRGGPIQRAELKSLKLELPGESRLTIDKRVFETLDALNLLHQPAARMLEARIDLKLAGRRASVRLKICPGRDTILGATGIPVVEEWLVARGFAVGDDRKLMASA